MLKNKAAENYKIAQLARGNGNPNAAASRIYYAFYQAGIGELTEKGVLPEKYNQNVTLAHEQQRINKWTHGMFARAVRNPRLDLGKKLQDIIQDARVLREKGDYSDTDNVEDYELEEIFLRAPDILGGWGVPGVWT